MNLSRYYFSFLVLFFSLDSFGQIPTEVPKPQDNSPVDFSNPVNIIIFIVLPIAMVVFALIWRNERRKNKADEE